MPLQEFVYVTRIKGEKNGRHYDLVRLSDGVESLTVQNKTGDAVEDYSRGDAVACAFKVSAGFKGPNVELVSIEGR